MHFNGKNREENVKPETGRCGAGVVVVARHLGSMREVQKEEEGGPSHMSQFHHMGLRPSLGPLPVLERTNVVFSIEVAEPMNIFY